MNAPKSGRQPSSGTSRDAGQAAVRPPWRVLVIDASAEDGARYCDWLEADPGSRFIVFTVRGGAEAFELLSARHVDCIVLSDSLPDIHGAAFVAELLDKAPSCPALVMLESPVAASRPQEFPPGPLTAEHLSRDEISATTLRLTVVHAVRTNALRRELREARVAHDAFAYAAAHDLKSPLRHILSYAEILESKLGGVEREEEKRYLTHIRTAGERMDDLVSELLTYSTTERAFTNLSVEPLSAVVSNVLGALEVEVAERGALIEVGTLPDVLGERSALRHICFHLLSNAIKFSDRKPARIRIEGVDREGLVTLSVRDNGIGIANDQLANIFRPFVRLNPRRDYSGSGMGLATCQRAVERLGGELRVESQLGVGSTFRVTLRSPDPQGKTPSQQSTLGRRRRLLIVDDEGSELTLVEELLGHAYDLVTASTGPEALCVLNEEKVDAVLCDYSLDQQDGMEVLLRIRDEHPEVVRILTSAFAPPDLRHHLSSGAVHYFFPKMASKKQIDAALSASRR